MTSTMSARRGLQRKILTVLAIGQVLGAIGTGASFSIGSLMAAHISGSPALGGLSATFATLGTAIIAFPLARYANRWGRRWALSLGLLVAAAGSAIVVWADVEQSFSMFIVGIALVGAGNAVNLQTRFAATDLAQPATRARDLSLVVWATTIGVVIGPNLVSPGDAFGLAFGLPTLAGAFVIAAFFYAAGVVFYSIGLRPDPLLEARAQRVRDGTEIVSAKRSIRAAFGILRATPMAAAAVVAIALSHGVMVGIMSMTPVHLSMMNVVLPLIGLTVSLHTAGMYGFSPLFGWLSDRWGRITVIVLGQIVLLAALVVNILAPEDMTAIAVSMTLLGLGWSASTVAASALLTESVTPEDRPTVQGLSDTLMSLTGAAAGAAAGLTLAAIGYGPLSVVTIALTVAVTSTVLIVRARTRGTPTA
jgi:MFS family permease